MVAFCQTEKSDCEATVSLLVVVFHLDCVGVAGGMERLSVLFVTGRLVRSHDKLLGFLQ